MPIVQISLNVDLVKHEKQDLLSSVAQLVSQVMEKPIHDVMVSLTMGDFVMQGGFEPAAFIEFRCLSGLQVDDTMKHLYEGMLGIVQQYAPVDPSRVYVNFFEVRPEHAWRFQDGVAVCPKNTISVR